MRVNDAARRLATHLVATKPIEPEFIDAVADEQDEVLADRRVSAPQSASDE